MNKLHELLRLSEENDPEAIYEIAQLYNSGEVSSSGDVYIEWFKRFLDNDVVKLVLCDLDDDEHSHDITIDPYTYASLVDKIEEAGICLGLYYRFSNRIDELKFAQGCFYDAWIASRFDHIEIDDDGEKTDVVSLMAELDRKISETEELLND